VTNRIFSKPGPQGPGLALCTLLAVVLGALAPAAADARPPHFTERPVVVGTPQVGATLQAQAAWDDDPDATASWQWLRCDGTTDNPNACAEIGGATAQSYTVTDADLGNRLRVEVVLSNEEEDSAPVVSPATALVTAAPAPEPEPSPEPTATPGAQPEPSPEPTATPGAQPEPTTTTTTAPAPAPAPVSAVLDVRAAAPRLMSPLPLVRIRGVLTRSGARITLMTVRAPRGARIAVLCFGRSCPARRWARTASLTRIARFEARLRAGTRLVITITKPRRIGKHTTIVIRLGAAPTRRDRCLMPGERRPVRCPAV
jgi:hypothetical protein